MATSRVETILVVDDNRVNRLIVARLLSKQGYRLVDAESADEAKRRFEEEGDVDLLGTDVMMPGTSGPDLANALRTIDPGLRVLCMSAASSRPTPGCAFPFLGKPFASDLLVRSVRDL